MGTARCDELPHQPAADALVVRTLTITCSFAGGSSAAVSDHLAIVADFVMR
jgi:hypothetical protein